MVEESVKIEVLGISTETGGKDQDNLSVVEIKPQKELELVAEEDGRPARVILKDVESESSEEFTSQDGARVADGGANGTEQSSEGANGNSESPELEEEEPEECGFCLYMKGGPCGGEFSTWQNCVDAAEKSGEDIVEKCSLVTSSLKACMENNRDYYGPVLDAEKAMGEVASQEEYQAAETAGKPADQGTRPQDNSENESAESDDRGKVVEVVGVTSVDGEVIEVVDIVVESEG